MERIKITRMKEIWKNAGFIIHGMKGCCGHITNFSVVSGFAILIFCFFTYFLVCLFPKNVFDAYTCLHVNSSKKIFKFISQTIFTKLLFLQIHHYLSSIFVWEHSSNTSFRRSDKIEGFPHLIIWLCWPKSVHMCQ